ncbi:MAG TPA: hypothetical protein VFF88_09705 [Methylocella sp.]|nr:hypothetical protein [Methylocella sp.]
MTGGERLQRLIARPSIADSPQAFDNLEPFHDIGRMAQRAFGERALRSYLPSQPKRDDGAHADTGQRMTERADQTVRIAFRIEAAQRDAAMRAGFEPQGNLPVAPWAEDKLFHQILAAGKKRRASASAAL